MNKKQKRNDGRKGESSLSKALSVGIDKFESKMFTKYGAVKMMKLGLAKLPAKTNQKQ